MLPVIITIGPLASADDDCVCASQTPLGAGAMTINGASATAGVATLATARRIIITSAGNDSAKTFRITGTNADNNPIRETVTGANIGAAQSTQDYKTVTEVYASAATAAAVIVGTNTVASTPWKQTNWQHQAVSEITWYAEITAGSGTYGLEWTADTLNDNQNTMGGALGNYPTPPTAIALATFTAQTTTGSMSQDNPIQAWRLVLTGTTPFTVKIRALEGGISEAS